jgi:hypothetical protein
MSTPTKTVSLDNAIDQYLAHLERLDAQRAADETQAELEKQARCRLASSAFVKHLAETEHILTYPEDWYLTEHHSKESPTYTAIYNDNDTGLPFPDDHSNPKSGVRIHYILPDGSRVPTAGTLHWHAWHNSNNGYDFATFLAAITYARTGRS